MNLIKGIRIALWGFSIVGVLSTGVLLGHVRWDFETAETGMRSADLNIRQSAFYGLLKPHANSKGSVRSSVEQLVAAHPNEREQIARALIEALELEVAHRNLARQNGEQLTETFSDYWADLMAAVSYLRDPRAVKGLLGGVDTGGIATEGLADICPSAIDALIDVARAPNPTFRGMPLGFRNGAVAALGGCLNRTELLRANPEVRAKARAALLEALDDADWTVRIAAVNGTLSFREDATVKEKLDRMAGLDPYMSPLPRLAPGTSTFAVRDAARDVLAADERTVFYLVRSADNLECRVDAQIADASLSVIMGPFPSRQSAERAACRNLDSIRIDTPACRTIAPPGVCGR